MGWGNFEMKGEVGQARGYRLDELERCYLVMELLLTNKTHAQIARKFGISRQAVSALAKKLPPRPKEPRFLYRADGTPFF